MQVIADKALLLRVKQPEAVLSAVAKSARISDYEVLVRWGMDEVSKLRSMGIRAPSPIQAHYDWPGLHTPMEHQKTTAAFLTLHHRAFCFSEQGTGKTASAIWAADYLMRAGKVKRVLIICPVSIMDVAWRADLFACAMHRTVGIAYGTPEKRRKVLAQNTEFVIINYAGVQIVAPELASGGFDLVIVDEATAYKDVQSRRWKTLNKLLLALGNPRLWMMTGTPAAQSPEDAYGLAKLVNPSAVPRTAGRFRDMVMLKVSQFRWVPRKEAPAIVHNALQPAIRFTKEECLDLPEIVYRRRDVELTKQQRRYYEHMRKHMMLAASGTVVTAANAAVMMNKLLQLSCGAVYNDDGDVVEFNISHRYSVLREVIDDAPKKVLVFVPYRHIMDVLLERMRKDGYTAEMIRGDVPLSERSAIFNRFQESDAPRVLLIQPQAASHGVTLTAAATIVWWGPIASLETYAQANARTHRTGQTNRCLVVQLQGSPVERRLYEMLDNKQSVHEQLVGLYKEVLDMPSS